MPEFLGSDMKKVTRWAKSAEFQGVWKQITPVSFKRLSKEKGETNSDDKFLDKEGCTYRLVFIDHDNGNMERQYENCYESFLKNIQEVGLKKGQRYEVSIQVGATARGGKKYTWLFNPVVVNDEPAHE